MTLTGSSSNTANNRCVTVTCNGMPFLVVVLLLCFLSFFCEAHTAQLCQNVQSFLFSLTNFFFFSFFFYSKNEDAAKDESDYSDGYVTDGFATMDVFEYEVDDLSDSEDLESHGSSSGTDV